MVHVLSVKMLTGINILPVKLIYPFTLSKMQMLHVWQKYSLFFVFVQCLISINISSSIYFNLWGCFENAMPCFFIFDVVVVCYSCRRILESIYESKCILENRFCMTPPPCKIYEQYLTVYINNRYKTFDSTKEKQELN